MPSFATQRVIEDVEKQFDELGFKRGIKEDGSMSPANLGTGDFLSQTQVRKLMDLTVNEAGWLKFMNVEFVDDYKGEIPQAILSGPISEAVGISDPGKFGARRFGTQNVAYECKKIKVYYTIPYETFLRAKRTEGSIQAFNKKIQNIIVKGLSNDLATLVIQGDTSLDPEASDWNRLLSRCDGLYKLAFANANVLEATAAIGKAFDYTVWGTMRRALPSKYKNDPRLAWLTNPTVDDCWQQSLVNPNTTSGSQGSPLGDAVITRRTGPMPLGIPQIIIPQIQDDQRDTVAVATPTDITDVTTYIKVGVNALVGSATAAGRYVKVTYEPNGETETRAVYFSTNNYINTTGLLGQTTVDTTNTNYTVEIADFSSVFLTNPKNVGVPIWDQVRAYREYNKDTDEWEIVMYYFTTVLIHNADAMVALRKLYCDQSRWA